MKKYLLLGFLALSLTGCKWLTVRVESEDETFRMALPFSLVRTAIKFTDGDVLELDDLGGVNQEIDIRMLAQGLKEHGDKVQIHVKDDDMTLHGFVEGRVFKVRIDDPEADEKVTINLPLSIIETMAEKDKVTTHDLVRSLRRYRGILVEVKSPDESVRISLR